MNIPVGQLQPLQLLDDQGRELHSSKWSVDNPELASIEIEQGQVSLYARAPGVVRVFAYVSGVMRTREIAIWPAGERILGVHWRVPAIGRETANLQAVPTDNGPDLFSLDETANGTYVRGFTNLGLQLWRWRVPNEMSGVEFVCGDDLGGAIVAAAHAGSYNLYVVSKEGKLMWSHTFEGMRRGHALNYENMLHLLNQPSDGTWATITAWEAGTGKEKFTLKLPSSHENEKNVRRSGNQILCAPGRSVSNLLRVMPSRLFVSTDGNAYAAFTQDAWTVGVDQCTPGAVLDQKKVAISRTDRLVLWRIHPDGNVESHVIEHFTQARASFADTMNVLSPTGDIIPDGFGGVLLSVRMTHTQVPQKVRNVPDEFVYRISQDGEVEYKFPLPRYSGVLHDAMVLGENDLGFATRGGMLVAFNVKDGSEVWRWDSGAPEIEIEMATAGGGCAVQTPEGLVLVEDGVKKRVVAPRGAQMYNSTEFIHTAN
jgi:outer membrane protein assembly factor BamB